jgi:ubiquinol-cytochrome c reductase cytochrome c subunit
MTMAALRCARLAAIAGALLGAAGAAADDAAGDRARGRQVFVAVGCYECHGYVGQGSVQSGPRIAPEPMPVDSLRLLLRQPINVMPAYAESALSDRDIADIHAYLASIPKPPSYKDIELLKP